MKPEKHLRKSLFILLGVMFLSACNGNTASVLLETGGTATQSMVSTPNQAGDTVGSEQTPVLAETDIDSQTEATPGYVSAMDKKKIMAAPITWLPAVASLTSLVRI